MSDEFLEYRDVEESQSGSSIPQSSAPTTLIYDEKVYCIVPVIKHEKEELCDISYKFTVSTSNLKYHLNTVHNITDNNKKNKKDKYQQKISSIFNKIISHGKSQQYKLNIALLEFIITNSQLFNILKSNRFKKFLFKLDPVFVIPCDKTIKILILETYKVETAKSKTGYIGITADIITTYLEKYIENYNLEKKVIYIITDNSSNMKVAINILNNSNNNIQRLLCVA
ncbi:1255_t:CDS:2 [Funneliformis geosporum]|uniref:1255_t:CDS:1 n=1 Tax=Funneliformis geosporum TaxID=1117311 RepID=A0A9W4X2I1_9GLOM|nr:1255_t:CDS:2 [Funneliformis geosporum]